MSFSTFLRIKKNKETAKFIVPLASGEQVDFPCVINRQESFIEARFDKVASAHELLAPALQNSYEEDSPEEDYLLAFGNGESQRVRIVTAPNKHCAWLEIVRAAHPTRRRADFSIPTDAMLHLESSEGTGAPLNWPTRQRIHLSGKGLYTFSADKKIVGDTYLMDLILLDKKRTQIQCLAKVVKSVEKPAKNYFKNKFIFLDIAEKDRETIIGFCIETQRRLIWSKKRSDF